MDINDYLIDQAGKDWVDLLAGWAGTIPKVFTLWLVNQFGDAFIVLEDGSVHMLDVGRGSFSRIADSRDHFAALVELDDNADLWLMITLVDRCARSMAPLEKSQCYGYKIPPMLGGGYGVENIEPTDLSVHYHLLAQIHEHTKDLPDGAVIDEVTIRDA